MDVPLVASVNLLEKLHFNIDHAIMVKPATTTRFGIHADVDVDGQAGQPRASC